MISDDINRSNRLFNLMIESENKPKEKPEFDSTGQQLRKNP